MPLEQQQPESPQDAINKPLATSCNRPTALRLFLVISSFHRDAHTSFFQFILCLRSDSYFTRWMRKGIRGQSCEILFFYLFFLLQRPFSDSKSMVSPPLSLVSLLYQMYIRRNLDGGSFSLSLWCVCVNLSRIIFWELRVF